jgi:hypothetical protein
MSEETKKETPKFCVTCAWLNLEIEAKLQECRRNAPTRNRECTLCCFPPVNLMCWCGQWEQALPDVLVARKKTIREQQEKEAKK